MKDEVRDEQELVRMGGGDRARENTEAGLKGGEWNGNPCDLRMHSERAGVCCYPGKREGRGTSIRSDTSGGKRKKAKKRREVRGRKKKDEIRGGWMWGKTIWRCQHS